MKALFSNARWKWLRLTLALLLPLHAGVAQAIMVMPAQAAVTGAHAAHESSGGEAVPMQMADDMPCHEDAGSWPSHDHPAQHKGGCCDAGSCHCTAVCGLAVSLARALPRPGAVESRFSSLPHPAAATPPDLRPPIA